MKDKDCCEVNNCHPTKGEVMKSAFHFCKHCLAHMFYCVLGCTVFHLGDAYIGIATGVTLTTRILKLVGLQVGFYP